ncbi:MAG TPA: hypothetical protein VH277_05035, partial [Gemmatimonadaceae bacterium]|nr:hypothetical protein [Gemmatimonadaceae bacterium]
SVVSALAAGSTDAATAGVTAPVAEGAALTLGDESRDEALTSVARLWLAANRPDEALRVARPIARRTRRDFNSPWYAELARVLLDAGDESAGEQLYDRHVSWYESERSAEGLARAASAVAKWGRTTDAQSFADQAAAELAALREGSGADVARRTLVGVYLSLGQIADAIRVAAQLTALDERMRALLAIAAQGHASGSGDNADSGDIEAALRQTGLWAP